MNAVEAALNIRHVIRIPLIPNYLLVFSSRGESCGDADGDVVAAPAVAAPPPLRPRPPRRRPEAHGRRGNGGRERRRSRRLVSRIGIIGGCNCGTLFSTFHPTRLAYIIR